MPPEPWRFKRRYALASIGLAGLLAAWLLDMRWDGWIPRGQGWALWKRFFAAALQPAWTYQGEPLTPDLPPFLWVTVRSLAVTMQYALAAMGLALIAGIGLGILSSQAFWRVGPGRPGAAWRGALRALFRSLCVGLRSVHELLWAIVLLAAIGLSDTAAILALSIPFTGILAKVFSELLDEAPTTTDQALEGLGARPALALLVGRLPAAWPDMAAYGFYRFECSVRSSAVLGFFGFPTIGYHLELSFASLHYREVWTQLYLVLLLVWGLERWSQALRRRAIP